jgi:hypothetical protein
MNTLWYNNPQILLSEWYQFFPNNSLSREQKINAIARFAIYYLILIIIFNQNLKWLSISIILLIISFCLGYSENFEQINKVSMCVKPTKNNPFMNYMISDDVNRESACEYDDIKDE